MAGAPTKYKEEYNEQAYKLCLLGHTDEELAVFFDVHVDTIYEWKKVHQLFSEAISRGKQFADMEVAQALYDGARDRIVTEQVAVKIRESVIESGKAVRGAYKESVVLVDVQKNVPADFRNQQFWLKNRQPDKWRDKQEIEHGGNVTQTPIEVKVYNNAPPLSETEQEAENG